MTPEQKPEEVSHGLGNALQYIGILCAVAGGFWIIGLFLDAVATIN